MKKRLSIFLISIGLILTTSSSLMSITGNVISENVNIGGSVLGLAFIIGGLVLFLAQKAGGLEGKIEIITTKGFDKMIKRVSKKVIKNALAKIGTGKGKEEYVKEGKYKGYWSIRPSKGARIYYLLEENTAEVIAYEPPSKHR